MGKKILACLIIPYHIIPKARARTRVVTDRRGRIVYNPSGKPKHVTTHKPKYRDCLIRIRTIARNQVQRAHKLDILPYDGDVRLEAVFYRNTRRGDFGNLMGTIEDALQDIVYYNDKQVGGYTEHSKVVIIPKEQTEITKVTITEL